MKRFRVLLLGVIVGMTTLVLVSPAVAGTSSTSWNHSAGLWHLPLGVEYEVGTLTHTDVAGSQCTAYVETSNGESTHEGNNLNVYLNGAELVTLDGFEDLADTTRSDAAGFVSTGSDEFVVYIEATVTDALEAASDVGQITSSEGFLRVTCEPPPPPPSGGEGCTPGYWKQPHHFDSWVGYAPSDSFDDVFGVDSDFDTLLDGARARGGQDNALARHAVAALLNASTSGVSYEYSVEEVIAKVQYAYDSGNFNMVKNVFEEQNEMGCPLN